jgi:uncharacterized Zn finger protein
MLEASIQQPNKSGLYCPRCAREVDRPLVCSDCLAVICRECGSVLESVDDLGVG